MQIYNLTFNGKIPKMQNVNIRELKEKSAEYDKKYYYWEKQIARFADKYHKRQTNYDELKYQLLLAFKKGVKISYQDLTQKLKVPQDVLKSVILQYSELLELFNKVKKSNTIGKVTRNSQINAINDVLDAAIQQNEKISMKEISQALEIPLHNVIDIVYKKENKLAGKFAKVSVGKPVQLIETAKNNPGRKLYTDFIRNLTLKASNYMTTSNENGTNFIGGEQDYIEGMVQVFKSRNVFRHAEVIKRMFESSPAFMDMILTGKDSTGKKRNLDKLDLISRIHRVNPQLTIDLFEELDNEGKYKYTEDEIIRLVYEQKQALAANDKIYSDSSYYDDIMYKSDSSNEKTTDEENDSINKEIEKSREIFSHEYIINDIKTRLNRKVQSLTE